MSIASALFTNSQSRLFGWLFGQPERSYHLSELNRLVDAQLVASERTGNLRRFQANPDSPVFSELVALTRKTMSVQAACIYGSVAKQTDSAKSDIDVMLIGE